MDEYDLLLKGNARGRPMKNQTESLEHASVRQYCKAVRMPTIGANFLSLAEQAVNLETAVNRWHRRADQRCR